jgi:hypothetical protein
MTDADLSRWIKRFTEGLNLSTMQTENHWEKIKGKRYKSPRALQMAAAQIFHGAICLRNQWHYLAKQAGLQQEEVIRNSASLAEEDYEEGEIENGHKG